MTPRTSQLRRESLDAPVTLSEERALLMTAFYESAPGDCSVPVQRARSFRHLCEHQTIWIGPGELIVGERGPRPKAVPTFPELTCHSLDDLRILDTREKNRYAVPASCFRAYEEIIIPYWRGRSLRDRLFALMSPGWLAAYEAGLFTEFMEQRAPGHTVLDEKIYGRGLCDLQRQIEGEQLKPQLRTAMAAAFGAQDEDPAVDLEQLQAMSIACDALIHFAGRHAALARRQAEAEADPQRRAELLRIADVCTRVPAQAPRDFHEALQAYWFCHLGVIT
ncbi:MAG: formate C-acetyltransferase/glycerol dehydratase family glycyl radical enzyme, partial [Armatimonadetes bacterium]|nr:formate C-acetyltransferase/glycerol dehydratase family glycyl radical enzyme [Armatimonadota bacterium]